MPDMEPTYTRLPIQMKKIAKEFCEETLGITLAEYLRSLVKEDLDKRSIFTDRFKKLEEIKE